MVNVFLLHNGKGGEGLAQFRHDGEDYPTAHVLYLFMSALSLLSLRKIRCIEEKKVYYKQKFQRGRDFR